MKRFIGVLVMALLISSTAFAGWEVKGDHFGLTKNMVSKIEPPAAGGETDLILIPTAALGLGVDSGSQPSYGADVAYDFVLGKVEQAEGTNVTVTPYFGLGAALYVDVAPWLNSNLQSAVVARVGLNVIGPEINGFVPGIMETWDLNTGERKTMVNMNVPFGLFSDSGVLKVLGL